MLFFDRTPHETARELERRFDERFIVLSLFDIYKKFPRYCRIMELGDTFPDNLQMNDMVIVSSPLYHHLHKIERIRVYADMEMAFEGCLFEDQDVTRMYQSISYPDATEAELEKFVDSRAKDREAIRARFANGIRAFWNEEKLDRAG